MAKILVVDDAQILRISITKYIEELGHSVIATATNGDEAVMKYKEFLPDLVTMDISMPERNGIKNGIDALIEIMKVNPEAKVIMVTSHGEQRLVMDAISKGSKGYLLKPVTKEKLVTIIEKLNLT